MQFVRPTPFKEAVQKLGQRTAVASGLSSAEWSALPVELRERALWSAKIEDAHFLSSIQGWLNDFVTGAREELPNGETALKVGSRAAFVEQARSLAQQRRLGPEDPADIGTIKDIQSERRLALIFDTQVKAAHDFGNWKQGMDPDVLDQFPAQRFIRVVDVTAPRQIHAENEGVVRLKTDLQFWLSMNSPEAGGFGVPWGPWGFNSGMDVEDVERDEAEALGLIDPLAKIQPVERELNDHLSASVQSLSPDVVDWLKTQFGSQIRESDGRVAWTPRK